ncbi:MAG: hypothetical protein JJU02_05290 [Cryomorphaceae bacterium]|nr:hypothetical protein [Cryomorphaceae bacterium]
MNYNKNFVDLVNSLASLKMNEDIIEHYIGTGNPNSKILFLGKELGFDENESQLQREVLNNISDWQKNINSNVNFEIAITQNYNPLIPYKGAVQKSGHTWSKYQFLSNKIFGNDSHFFSNVFVSEIGHKPSKYSKNQGLSQKRKELINEKSFFKDFEIILLACGNYLNPQDIIEIFSVNHLESKSQPRKKLEIYGNKNKLVINTRQLSMDVSNLYLTEIASEIIQFKEKYKYP